MFLFTGPSIFLCILSAAVNADHSAHQSVSKLNTFADPDSIHRPPFRYWLPDSSVKKEIVTRDLILNGNVGAGGFEFVPFFEYGGELGAMPLGANWSTNGFGTESFRELFAAALKAHGNQNLYMDFALGPNQGQGVPIEPTNEGLQWDLIPYTERISQDGVFDDVIPGWGSGNLLSLVSALIVSNRTEAVDTSAGEDLSFEDFTLSEASLSQQKDAVDANTGRATLTVPRTNGTSYYRIFAFYQALTGHQNLHFESSQHKTVFDNGSYTVDHFDSKGAYVITRFWEEHILDDEIRFLLSKIGRYAWEDSLELKSNVTWSRSLPERFRKLFDYDLLIYLPLIAFGNNNLAVQADSPGAFRCHLDTEDGGEIHINNYRSALVHGYQEYLQTLSNWCHQTLELQLSVQPGYGMPMDTQATIPFVDAPECESLSFFDSVDSYRQFSGPALLSGKAIISNEMGAVRNSAYAYHLSDLLFSTHRAFAGGINRVVIHGQAYSGQYFETTWPGHTPFRYLFSDPWSQRMPTWEVGFPPVIEYISRLQFVLQQGIAKVDIAIYNKESATTMRQVYQASDLLENGWSFSYLSPDNFDIPTAKVTNGTLSSDGPSWKALVVEKNQNLTMAAIRQLKNFAEDGLPLIISGGRPESFPLGRSFDKNAFDRDLSDLLRTKNVYSVDSGQVSRKLFELGLEPIAKYSTETHGNSPFSVWRQDSSHGYLFLYADKTAWSGRVTLRNVTCPRRLNPWTGNITNLTTFTKSHDRLSIPIELAANQSAVFQFDLGPSVSEMEQHLVSTSANILNAESNAGSILLSISRSNTTLAVLSNGTELSFDATKLPPTVELVNWTLTAEHWEAPENLTYSSTTIKYNTTHKLHRLQSWTNIPELVNASGIGYYTTIFRWPPSEGNQDQNLGAILSLESPADGAVILINGEELPPLDLVRPRVEITSALVYGENIINMVTPTTLWNYLRTILDDLRTAGSLPLPITLEQALGVPMNGPTESGLRGNVTITPIRRIRI